MPLPIPPIPFALNFLLPQGLWRWNLTHISFNFQAVIGARAALALPSVDSLDRVETNCDIDVTILGLSRIPLYNVLLQRFTDHMDTLTSQLLNLPIPTAVEKLECLWCVWGATDAFGVQAPAKELEMARSVLPRIRILLSEMPCTDSERASLETVLGGMQVRPVFP